MKKIAAMLSAALVLSLAAPALAAVEFGGKLETEFKLHEDEATGTWQIDGKTGLDIETEVKAEGGDTVKAVVQLKPWRYQEDGEFGKGFTNPEPVQIAVDKAWVETQGAYWHGGPEVNTRIGDLDVEWSDYVANLETRGVRVEGMTVGPVSAKGLYAWEAGDRPMAVAAEGAIEGVQLGGVAVRRGETNNFAFSAGTQLLPGTSVGAVVALDGVNNHIYKVTADSASLVPGVKLSASYRAADDNFLPMYGVPAVDEDGNPVDRNARENVNYDLLDGYSVAAETTQSGIHLKASYDDPHKEAKLSADTVFHLGRLDVNGKYSATIVQGEDVEHTVKASTMTDLMPQLQDVGLSAQAKLVGDALTWNTAAEYAAPNGLNLGVEYDSVDGAAATAGVTVEF